MRHGPDSEYSPCYSLSLSAAVPFPSVTAIERFAAQTLSLFRVN